MDVSVYIIAWANPSNALNLSFLWYLFPATTHFSIKFWYIFLSYFTNTAYIVFSLLFDKNRWNLVILFRYWQKERADLTDCIWCFKRLFDKISDFFIKHKLFLNSSRNYFFSFLWHWVYVVIRFLLIFYYYSKGKDKFKAKEQSTDKILIFLSPILSYSLSILPLIDCSILALWQNLFIPYFLHLYSEYFIKIFDFYSLCFFSFCFLFFYFYARNNFIQWVNYNYFSFFKQHFVESYSFCFSLL